MSDPHIPPAHVRPIPPAGARPQPVSVPRVFWTFALIINTLAALATLAANFTAYTPVAALWLCAVCVFTYTLCRTVDRLSAP